MGWTGSTKSSGATFPSYAILARVGIRAISKWPGSYAGQLGAGGSDMFPGFLAKFANAVWRLFDSSASSVVAVDLLYVPKRIGTVK